MNSQKGSGTPSSTPKKVHSSSSHKESTKNSDHKKSNKSDKNNKKKEEMDVDMPDKKQHMEADEESNISSLEVSEDESEMPPNSKKRKRLDSDEELDLEFNSFLQEQEVKKAVVDVNEIQSDDIELWVFKVPAKLKARELDGKSLSIGGKLELNDSQYSFFEGAPLERDSMLNVWPSVSDERLVLGKPFSKFIHVSETPKSANTEQSQLVQNLAAFLKFGTTRSPSFPLNDENPLPELKVRYVPGGASIPESSVTSIKQEVTPQSSTSSSKRHHKEHSKDKKHKDKKLKSE